MQTLTDKYLRDVVLNFILAGRDTTACLLSWLCYELTLHPVCSHCCSLFDVAQDVMSRLQSEVDTVLHGELPTYQNVQSLPLLQAALFEALRLHPSVPIEIKV